MRFSLDYQSRLFHITPQFLTGIKPIQTDVAFSTLFIHGSILIHDIHNFQIVLFTQFVIVGVMSWGNFQGTRSKFHVDVFISNNGDRACLAITNIGHWDQDSLSNQMTVTFIFWIHTNRSITKDSFRTSRCHRQKLFGVLTLLLFIFHHILEIIQFPLLLTILHLQITHCRHQSRTPIDHVRSTIYQSLLMQSYKRLGHSHTQRWVHRKPLPRPIRRSTQRSQLRGNRPTLLFLILPHPFQKLLPWYQFTPLLVTTRTGNFFVGRTTFPLHHECLLHLQLCCDTRMIRPRCPQYRPTSHPVKPRQYILQCDKDGVAHVQPPRNIGWGHGEYVWFFSVGGGGFCRLFGVWFEAAGLFPPLIELRLE
mmetsp:Transcript_30513/g.47775  ORF Transcript_30513/g.47775 Transcript_30513/m.47775 type:complete len:365 (+) Transcript_30513:4039-5133(+)